MTDRIAFLDVDGTLRIGGSADFTPDAIAALHVLRDAGYRFVLHSTQRVNGYVAIADQLMRHSLHLDGGTLPTVASKRDAIVLWLDSHYLGEWPDDVLVIDDQAFPVPKGVTFVLVDANVGLRVSNLPDLPSA